MSTRLTILGKSPSWQDRDGACSGYLAHAGGIRLLIDCGNGVFGKLRRHTDYEQIDAVVLTHLHADHMLDLAPFSYALTYGPRTRAVRPKLFGPPGARAALRLVCSAWESETLVEDAFELSEYDPGSELTIGDVRLRFQPVPHYIPSNAIELTVGGGPGRLVLSADCGPNDELVEFSAGADLLLIESTRLDGEDDDASAAPGHLTAAQAGAIARRAGVARVVLTHYSDQLDRDALRRHAETAFGGPVELAAEGDTYEV
jgi:ribonuclease BN (tRNA processing enzyme)